MIWHVLTIFCGIAAILAALFPEKYSYLFAGDFLSMVVFLCGAAVLFACLALMSYREWI